MMMFDFQVGEDRNCCQKPQIDDENLGNLWLQATLPGDVDRKGVRTFRYKGEIFFLSQGEGILLGWPTRSA